MKTKIVVLPFGDDEGKQFQLSTFPAYTEYLFAQEVIHCFGVGTLNADEWQATVSMSSLIDFFYKSFGGNLPVSDDPEHDMRLMLAKAMRFLSPQHFKMLTDKLLSTALFINDDGMEVKLMLDNQVTDARNILFLIKEAVILHTDFWRGVNL
jgi:hypothetical protein